MDQLYAVSLIAVEKHMRQQFAEPDERQLAAQAQAEPVRESRLTRARLRVSNALYALAASLDPAAPVPGRVAGHQH
ncbi:MAG TPA: hypothetical protein VD789_12790 [Thermomicrobiales bacterium]|nr:hypothetical protein [Thermomicrobiales bacterium]